jgi:hypothetical protein
MARPMTAQEKTQFQSVFPQLDVNAAVVSGEATPVYNCISWTVGVTTAWLWPGSSIQAFDQFYAGYGYSRRAAGPIAAWGHSLTAMTHGSVSGPSHGPRWESKCGGWAQIQHGRDELVSSTYGHIVAYYSVRPFGVFSRWLSIMIRLLARLRRGKVMPRKLTNADRTALREQAAALPAGLRSEFEERFERWREEWTNLLGPTSDPGAVRESAHFRELVALGPETLPALVEKLTDPANFLALQLYETLEPDEKMRVPIDPRWPEIEEGEQGRAVRTAALYVRHLGRTAASGA